jgi:2-oxoglutarate dehydrogenase E1 component
MIDNISCGEQMEQQNGVLLLPHGYEGQGAEHSSLLGLQLCARHMYVADCTTPANFFSLVEKTNENNFPKPLVVFTPKGLWIRCVSSIEDLLKELSRNN